MSDLQNDIKKYLRGELSPAERHALEKRALRDPFLADALEGAEHLNAETFAADVDHLSARITEAKKHSGWSWPLRIAAAVTLLMVSTIALWLVLQPNEKDETLALQKNQETPVEKDSATTTLGPAVKDEPSSTASSSSQPQSIPPNPSKPIAAGEVDKVKEQPVEAAELAMGEVKSAEETTPAPVMLKAEEKVAIADESDRSKKISVAGAERKRDAGFVNESTTVSKVIRGRVTSAEDGKGLPGVNVVIKGSTLGTLTDTNGNYYITVKEPSPVLVYSFIGMESAEVTVAESTEVDVTMEEDDVQLSEVVVTGYGGSSKSEEGVVDLAHPSIGYRAYKQYLQQNMRYPAAALENQIEGRVIVEFNVDANGTISFFKVIRGIGAGCDDELIRLIHEGPSWIPTKKEGKFVEDKARVQLRFKLPK